MDPLGREAGLQLLSKEQSTLSKAGRDRASVVCGTQCVLGGWAQEGTQGLPRRRLRGKGRGEGLHTAGCSGGPLTTGVLCKVYARASFFHVKRFTDKLSLAEVVTDRPTSSRAYGPPLQVPTGSPPSHLTDSCPSHRKLLESLFLLQCPFSALC